VPKFASDEAARLAGSFGKKLLGVTHESVITLTNEGNQALNINGFSLVGDAFSFTHNCPAMLAPAATCQVTVTFSPATLGDYSGSLTLDSNTAGAPAMLALKGTGSNEPPAVEPPPAVVPDSVQVDARGRTGGGGSMNFLMLGGLLFALGLRHSRRLGRKLGAGLGVMCALTGTAHADESARWYVGADFATARSDLSEGDVNAQLADLGYDVIARVDDSRTAWSIYGGYNWSKYFAVQAGYTDLGDVNSRFSGNAADIAAFMRDANVLQPQSAEGLDLMLVGRYPLFERLAISAQLGGFYWDAENELRDTSGARVIRKDDGFDLAYGAGLELSLTKQAIISAGWKRRDIDSESVDVISLGARYQW
jgi:hypothetical protein